MFQTTLELFPSYWHIFRTLKILHRARHIYGVLFFITEHNSKDVSLFAPFRAKCRMEDRIRLLVMVRQAALRTN